MYRFVITLIALVGTSLIQAKGPAPRPDGRAFPSAEAAAQALLTAAKSDNVAALVEILGPSGKAIVSTTDPVADRNMRKRFAERAGQKMKLIPYRGRATEKMILAGADGWPLPIPIVQWNGKWYFDTAKGKEEILSRRIGSNELDAIEVCRGFVESENAYADKNRTPGGVSFYAQKVISSPGEKDGLFWEGNPENEESAMGKIIAQAFAEGYTNKHQPYRGYYFKVLKAQGPHAPGGEMNYVENGLMTKGYAMIAWPATYGTTGIMTFLVDKTGIVYQKDLGRRTPEIAAAQTAYNPDRTWTPVRETTASRKK